MSTSGFAYFSVNVYVNDGVKVSGKRSVILSVKIFSNVNDNVNANISAIDAVSIVSNVKVTYHVNANNSIHVDDSIRFRVNVMSIVTECPWQFVIVNIPCWC